MGKLELKIDKRAIKGGVTTLCKTLMWIHEHQNWPNFSWDAVAIAGELADVRYA